MREYIDRIKCKIENQIQNQIRKQKSCAFYKKIAVYSIITMLLFWQTTGGHMRLAWWTTVYPQSLYETGIVEETEATGKKQEESIQIKWKLTEWIEHLFF